ncbi:BQ2448_4176 [Microbotryum intermedium]|uniref:BQ2448_4176 protein n=1 Tax=Microbotryum intermedium TaxID=269621 RepID=A0A238FIM0_9BASI|nr:BQ2448_4176 [Microbotryum intermedium]
MSKHSSRHTFTYKTEPVDILCDVYLPDETKFGVVAALTRQILASAGGKTAVQEEHKLPVLIYWHGGGLTAGNRQTWIPQWLFNDALDAGFIIVSADYRLLTPSSAHVVVKDAKDLVEWVHTKLNVHLSNVSSQLADLDRVAVSGSSAGGYVAYQACLHAQPTPNAICSIYGAGGDFLLDHWCTPKTEPWYKGRPLFALDDPRFLAILETPKTKPATTGTEATDPRNEYTFWLMQKGEWLDMVSGEAGLGARLRELSSAERAKAIPEAARITFPQFGIEKAQRFPPIIFVHGSVDEAILIEESRSLAETLRKKGTVEVEFLEFEGKNHSFDLDEELVELNKVVPFLLRHVHKK